MPWSKASRQSRGYGRPWEIAREQVLRRDQYLCQVCLHANPSRIKAAAAVDHIKAKAHGGDDGQANLRAICRSCHLAKTLADSGKKLRPRIGLDGWRIE